MKRSTRVFADFPSLRHLILELLLMLEIEELQKWKRSRSGGLNFYDNDNGGLSPDVPKTASNIKMCL
jgi:hypothetical protein